MQTVHELSDIRPTADTLAPLLSHAGAVHRHLCPRIVLGVRMGLLALRLLGAVDETYAPPFDNRRKRYYSFIEIDGCGASGIMTATDCHVVRRTARIVDYGKLALTLVDRAHGRAVRVTPSAASRRLAADYAPDARSRWHAYRDAYQIMPDAVLLTATPVQLSVSLARIISRPGVRVNCAACGEEIFNEREVAVGGQTLCRACAGQAYYRT